MFPLNIMTSLLKEMQPKHHRVLTLSPGQVLQGEVLKILPDQFSLVRLGSMQVQAKLEAPLEVGQKSWFQVQSSEHPITLKLITAPPSAQPHAQSEVTQLLAYFGLARHAAAEQLLHFLLQEQLPITKGTVRSALKVVEQLGAGPQVLQALKYALQKGVPVSKETVQSLNTFTSAPSLIEQLQRLESGLPEQQRAELQAIISKLAQDATQKPNGLLLFLQRLGVQFETNLSRAQAGSNSNLKPNPNPNPNSNSNLQQASQTVHLQQQHAGEQGTRSAQHATQSQSGTQVNSQQIVSHLLNKDNGAAFTSNSTAVNQNGQSPVNSAGTLGITMPRNPLLNPNQGVGDRVGSGLEFVQQQQIKSEESYSSLKSFFLQQLQDPGLSKQTKESIQTLIHTLQGQQILLSSESQQSFPTFIFQAFYPFESGLRAIYGQLTGKKEGNGQIDSENCRMLFQLSLEHLGDTNIDVHIQAKYLSITFYSTEVPSAGNSWLKENEKLLKETLQGLGYTLTHLKWKELNNEQGYDIFTKEQSRSYTYVPYQGVDIRL